MKNFKVTDTFSGIIGHDIAPIYVPEKGSGMDLGHLISLTGIEFTGLSLEDSPTVVIHFIKKE